MAAAIGLWAEANEDPSATTIQGAVRPLRSQVPAPRSPLPASYSQYSAPHGLLSPEALNQPLTKKYIRDYSSPSGIKWLNAVINNGSVYFPYIRSEIAERKLPPELIFLPFIESGYISTARSKSGAVGLWQFMTNSIPSTMKINDLLDERRDFRKATVAALRKLEENYRTLGNWPLALAAYNAGLNGARRAVQQAKTSDYWELCEKNVFKTETIHYVPKLLAVSYILSRPRQFGVDWWPQPVAWTVIRPARQASLDILASETGADRNMLHRLNAQLLYGITPPDKNYELIVPIAHAPLITAILEKEDARLILYYRYQIKYGDTLSALSRHYGVSLNLIEQHNPGITGRYLKIGETIVIPAFKETGPYSGAAPEAGRRETFGGTHVIVRGDTLWSLAVRYGVDPQVLAAENGMELNQILSVGKVLKVPIIE